MTATPAAAPATIAQVLGPLLRDSYSDSCITTVTPPFALQVGCHVTRTAPSDFSGLSLAIFPAAGRPEGTRDGNDDGYGEEHDDGQREADRRSQWRFVTRVPGHHRLRDLLADDQGRRLHGNRDGTRVAREGRTEPRPDHLETD